MLRDMLREEKKGNRMKCSIKTKKAKQSRNKKKEKEQSH